MSNFSQIQQTQQARGHTLIELIAVFCFIGLLFGLAVPTVIHYNRVKQLDEDIQPFAQTLRLVAELAVLQGKHFDIIIDVTDGYYTVYEVDPDKKEEDLDPEPYIEEQALDVFYIDKIDFDDGSHQFSGQLTMHATPEGWDKSLVFFLVDDQNEAERYVRCDKLTAHVVESNQVLELLEPQTNVSMTTSM